MASELRVNKLTNRSGLGTVTYTDTGAIVSGITTASNFKTGTTNVHSTGVELANINTGGSTATFGGDLSIPDTIVHTGDTNTKIRFPAADTFTVETAGSERFRIGSTGKFTFDYDGANENNLADIDFRTNNGFQIRGVDGNANNAKLYIGGAVGNQRKTAIIHDPTTGYCRGDLHFCLENAADLTDVDVTDSKMVIKADGKVGIGVTNPEAKLQIASGHIRLDNEYRIGTAASGDTPTTGTKYKNADYISWIVNNGEKARIDSNGRLLVGYTAAIGDLHGPQGTTNRNPFVQIHGANAASAGAALVSWANNAGAYYAPTLFLAHSGSGTKGTNAILPANGEFGSIVFSGDDGTDFVKGAMIRARLDGTPGNNDMPGRLVFYTTADGAQEPTERLRISASGDTTATGKIIAYDASSTSNQVRARIKATASNDDGRVGAYYGNTEIAALFGKWTGSQFNTGLNIPYEPFVVTGSSGAERLKIEADGTIDVTGNVAVGGNLYFDSDSDTTISNANTANWLRFKTGGQVVMDITDTHNVKIHDDHKLWFGASNDIQIFHNSGNNRNYFFSPQNDVYHEFAVSNSWTVQTTAGDKRIECPANGTDTGVRIYHNGSEKFRTTSGGCHSYGVLSTSSAINIGNSADLTFEDNGELIFGNSSDFKIYHVANSHNYIDSQGSSQDIFIQGKKDIYIKAGDNAGGYHTSIYCDNNGGVRLSHDNNPKLYTKSFGIQIEATPRVDLVGNGNSVELKFIGNSSSHRGSVYADNGNTIGFLKAGTGSWAARWHSDGKQTAHGDIVPNADTSQTLGNSSYQWSSIYGQNLIARTGYPLQFYANNSYAGRITTYGEWRLQTGTGSDNSVSTDFVHGIGGTSLDSVTSNLARLVMQERTGHWISFKNGSGTHYGSIYLSGSNVVYGGQSSDYRIKENVISVTDGITKLKKLKPIYFNYTTDSGFTGDDLSETHIGFIAHEFQEVCPHGASGVKDDLDIVGNCTDDSNTITQFRVEEHQKKDGETWTETSREPKYQQVDFSKAVPVLTAALQEAIAKIETLETKVAALESS